ncbi:hypothetical protein JHN59_41915 [Streptomyces sp. MBT49]|uniref:hypothetical protein n=1 Tax=Streptomyces sp. MBT49 TaxID=1488380 RepID=UPI00190C1E81|nr:hypothetical protein [Streptomyces sp. MBT49]MBK3631222.1 hypothetical protein [Streptomyces sp. MBT49]
MTTETVRSAGATDIVPAAVEVHDVHKWYGAHRVLDGVNLTRHQGPGDQRHHARHRHPRGRLRP